MARRDDFHELAMNCVMCPNKIPADRPKLAVTCSKECTIARKNYWRSKQDSRVCRYCMKPSTPEQRLAFQQWRRRPQDTEEEERYRLWRLSETNAARVKNRMETKRRKQAEAEEEHDGDTASSAD